MDTFIEFLNNFNLGKSFTVSNYSISSFSLFVTLLKEYRGKKVVIIVPDRETGDTVFNDIITFTNVKNVKFFNISKFFPFSRILHEKSYASDIMSLLYSLITGEQDIIIIPCSVFLKKFISPEKINSNIINVKKGDTLDREVLSYVLTEYGYEREYILSEKGEFSIRGDIIDIFLPNYEYPVRITLWDDFVEEINFFNIQSQKRYKNKNIVEISIIPNTEFIFTDENIENTVKLFKTEYEREMGEILQLKNFNINIAMCPELANNKTVSLFEYIELNDYITVSFNNTEIVNNIKKYEESLFEHFQDLKNEDVKFVSFHHYFHNSEIMDKNIDNIRLHFESLYVENSERLYLDLGTSHYKKLHKKISDCNEEHFKPIIDELSANKVSDYLSVFMFSDKVRRDNIFNMLQSKNVAVEKSDKNLTDLIISRKKRTFFLNGEISEGFRSSFLQISIISERDIFGRVRRVRKTEHIKEHTLKKFSELKEGDYVVHIEHGIGIFKGLKNLNVGDIQKEFILLEYLNSDKLYVPVEKFGFIQKYTGDDGYIPVVDKLGGERWAKTKERVKKAVESVAKELLELYASRKVIKGISFRGNDELIAEFGEKWEYDATEDQIKAIEDIFDDMDKEYPMDRLLCGDVGYGKTEVAIRAILKSVFAGYQVALLVPTTILTLQHYTTLLDRFREYPVRIEKISRFEDKKEQKKILEKTAAGEVDVLIGTHRLLQKDVKWKNLGLLIIDEEHKFGVKHKERIQLMKKNLDVLSMTATPIPRTLQMACLGVKDLSLINTPPEDRKSVDTKIIRFDRKIIKNAILKEVERGGQIYFVHNHIKTIYSMGELIKEIVPDIKIAIAYGQMDKDDLEMIYKDFIDKKYHLLLCTTIIESGLDNPNVNTIFINKADRFGISQLYQLRGRVGRSNLKAYAYFIIPAKERISSVALKRLKVLQTYAGLSEGFKLAMSDLEIRGAGNLFGEKQSGHILSVGFEFYMNMLEDAVKKLKGEIKEEEFEPEINYNINAFIPPGYIIDEKERLYVYKKLSLSESMEKLNGVKDEIEDRFGKLPEELSNLIDILNFKIILKNFHIPKADIKEDSVTLTIDEKSNIDNLKIVEWLQKKSEKISMLNENTLKVFLKSKTLQEKYNELKEILEELKI